MFISRGHFLGQFTVAMKDGQPIRRLLSVDTDLMVASRLVGYDPENGSEIHDLVKVDKVFFVSNNMPEQVKDLIPEGFELVEATVRKPEESGE